MYILYFYSLFVIARLQSWPYLLEIWSQIGCAACKNMYFYWRQSNSTETMTTEPQYRPSIKCEKCEPLHPHWIFPSIRTDLIPTPVYLCNHNHTQIFVFHSLCYPIPGLNFSSSRFMLGWSDHEKLWFDAVFMCLFDIGSWWRFLGKHVYRYLYCERQDIFS